MGGFENLSKEDASKKVGRNNLSVMVGEVEAKQEAEKAASEKPQISGKRKMGASNSFEGACSRLKNSNRSSVNWVCEQATEADAGAQRNAQKQGLGKSKELDRSSRRGIGIS